MPSSYVIGDHFESFIKSQIQQGRYASASEVIRSLRAEIQKGADSGEGIAANTVFAGVRERIAQAGAASSDGRLG
ncbi:type II toxin-antitoxin system ParD family antitoxin [Aquabacterium sp.]|uniref:ribbon-helix-helix domain-containing protein n=1 Tax=Aquabacterium sp. TaxID=1872578 RepID=UPI0019AD3995|nr:type II toxin-antitoxin system ParD family antitoxin [Aquabacterium sp.]MBC7699499.1 type II toxin-antitoxin system ParD family antitoxin [Aquabacterium sp.]